MGDSKALGAGKRVRFRMAGYLFTYRRATREARVRIDMWREDPTNGERYWVSVAACAPNRRSARSVALALAAWVRSCDIGPRRDVRAQAVAESFALLRDRLAVLEPAAHGTIRSGRQATVRRVIAGSAHGDARDAAA